MKGLTEGSKYILNDMILIKFTAFTNQRSLQYERHEVGWMTNSNKALMNKVTNTSQAKR